MILDLKRLTLQDYRLRSTVGPFQLDCYTHCTWSTVIASVAARLAWLVVNTATPGTELTPNDYKIPQVVPIARGVP